MMGAAALPLVGGLFTAIGGSMKKKPKVPEVVPIDTTAEQKNALEGNIANYGLIAQLSELANKTALEQGIGNIDALLGGGTREQITGLIQSGLRGELPKDVQDLIKRQSAERGGGLGVSGSQIARNLTLRDLGLTSLQRTDAALEAANRWLAVSQSQVPQFNFSSMFVTPAQAIQQANINQQNTFQRDWLANQLKSAYALSTIWGEAGIQTGQSLMGMGGMMGMGGGNSSPSPPPTPPPPSGGGGWGGWGGSGGVSAFSSSPGFYLDRSYQSYY